MLLNALLRMPNVLITISDFPMLLTALLRNHIKVDAMLPHFFFTLYALVSDQPSSMGMASLDVKGF